MFPAEEVSTSQSDAVSALGGWDRKGSKELLVPTITRHGVGAERRLPAGAGTAHLWRGAGAMRECGAGQRMRSSTRVAAGDAPWGGRGAPARSAPFRHPRRWCHGFRIIARPLTGGYPRAACSMGGRHGASAWETIFRRSLLRRPTMEKRPAGRGDRRVSARRTSPWPHLFRTEFMERDTSSPSRPSYAPMATCQRDKVFWA